MFIHAFLSSCINYSNILFSSLSRSALNHLQAIQNAAVRLLTRSNRWPHFTHAHMIQWLGWSLNLLYFPSFMLYDALVKHVVPYVCENRLYLLTCTINLLTEDRARALSSFKECCDFPLHLDLEI